MNRRAAQIREEWARAIVPHVLVFVRSNMSNELIEVGAVGGALRALKNATTMLSKGSFAEEQVEAFITAVAIVHQRFEDVEELPEWPKTVARYWVEDLKVRAETVAMADAVGLGGFDEQLNAAGSAAGLFMKAISTGLFHYSIQLIELFLLHADRADRTVEAATLHFSFNSSPTSRSTPISASTPFSSTPLTSGRHTVPKMGKVATRKDPDEPFTTATSDDAPSAQIMRTRSSPGRTVQTSDGFPFDGPPDTDAHMAAPSEREHAYSTQGVVVGDPDRMP